jgi:hypothetical protein
MKCVLTEQCMLEQSLMARSKGRLRPYNMRWSGAPNQLLVAASRCTTPYKKGKSNPSWNPISREASHTPYAPTLTQSREHCNKWREGCCRSTPATRRGGGAQQWLEEEEEMWTMSLHRADLRTASLLGQLHQHADVIHDGQCHPLKKVRTKIGKISCLLGDN